jgi:hypothetical protein
MVFSVITQVPAVERVPQLLVLRLMLVQVQAVGAAAVFCLSVQDQLQ